MTTVTADFFSNSFLESFFIYQYTVYSNLNVTFREKRNI